MTLAQPRRAAKAHCSRPKARPDTIPAPVCAPTTVGVGPIPADVLATLVADYETVSAMSGAPVHIVVAPSLALRAGLDALGVLGAHAGTMGPTVAALWRFLATQVDGTPAHEERAVLGAVRARWKRADRTVELRTTDDGPPRLVVLANGAEVSSVTLDLCRRIVGEQDEDGWVTAIDAIVARTEVDL